MQICLYSRIIVFFFDVEKSSLYKDQIRFSRSSIDNDIDNKMAIQKQSSFFESCIAIVVDVRTLTIVIKRTGIAVVVAIVVVVAIIILEFVGIAIGFADIMNRLSSIFITIAFFALDLVHFDIVYNLSNFERAGDYNIVDRYVQVIEIVKFDASVEQET